MSNSVRRWIMITVIAVAITFFPYKAVAQAASQSCENYNVISNALANKFPMDLFVGSSSLPAVNVSSSCPTINIFGTDWEICSVSMLVSLAKNVAVIKFAISSIQHL